MARLTGTAPLDVVAVPCAAFMRGIVNMKPLALNKARHLAIETKGQTKQKGVEMKHTPGKWEWHKDEWHGGYSGLYATDGTPVIVPQHENDGDDGAAWFASIDEAGEEGLSDDDRALIAAAPELVAALDTLMGELQVWSCSGESRDYKWAELRVKRFRALLDKVKEKQK